MVRTAEEIVRELEIIRSTVCFAGEELDLDSFDFSHFETLLDYVPQVQSTMTQELAERIIVVIDAVTPVFNKHTGQVLHELGGIKRSRKALNGYQGPAFHKRSQRLYRNI
jgi:hypothetical protein